MQAGAYWVAHTLLMQVRLAKGGGSENIVFFFLIIYSMVHVHYKNVSHTAHLFFRNV